MDGIICSGKQKKGKPTYAILEEWVPKNNKIYRDEALRELALRYFTSRGPASIQDFTWWSGLSINSAKLAMELNKDRLTSEVIQNQTYWLANTYFRPEPGFNEICFLPAYDEFLISYRDRTASLSLIDNKKAISNNGIFYPTLLHNGQIIGTWKRIFKNDCVVLSINLFKSDNAELGKILFKYSTRYSKFIDRDIKLA
jgi:hypothetical protein